MKYDVQAVRSGKYWELHIAGEGVTQSHTLAYAPAMVRDWLESEHERDFSAVQINVTPVLDSAEAKLAFAQEAAVQEAKSRRAKSRRRVANQRVLVHS